MNLPPVIHPPMVLAPGTLLGVADQIGASDVVVMPDLGPASARDRNSCEDLPQAAHMIDRASHLAERRTRVIGLPDGERFRPSADRERADIQQPRPAAGG